MKTGTIKRKTDRGFGFIEPADGGEDIFFHARGLVGVEYDDLQEGDSVQFDTETTDKGVNAVNVERLGAQGEAEAPAEGEAEMPMAA